MKAFELGVPEVQAWLAANLPSGAKVGVDPTVLDASKARAWKAEWANMKDGAKSGAVGASAAGAAAATSAGDGATSGVHDSGSGSGSASSGGPVLIGVPGDNLVDLLWGSRRPPVPRQPIQVHPDMYAGETVASKVVRVREAMVDAGCAVLVVTALDQVAWLFNLRGSDIACNPVFFAYALVGTHNRVSLFLGRGTGSIVANSSGSSSSSGIDKSGTSSSSGSGDVDWSWLGEGVIEAMADSNVTLRPYQAFETDLAQLVDVGAKKSRAASSSAEPAVAVLVDKGCCSLAVEAAVEASGARIIEADVSAVRATFQKFYFFFLSSILAPPTVLALYLRVVCFSALLLVLITDDCSLP